MLRKLLIAAVGLTLGAMAPQPAAAAPVVVAVATKAGWAAIAAFAKTSLGAFLINAAASVVLSFASSALLAQKPSQPDIKRELERPKSRPPYRFAYGRARVTGSPAPWRVKGDRLYGCLILNSRPSRGGEVRVFFDKREATLSGDILDFAGEGARSTDVPADQGGQDSAPRLWLGLGDQTGPPDRIVSEAPEHFQATDAWTGRTVLWVELVAGGSKGRQDRWPRTPPFIEVEADWSLVWDPRDDDQDADDPATWEWSDNQALCLLDALRRNPVRRYGLEALNVESFRVAADVADEPVALKAGGTEPRYRVGGMLVWSGEEIIDQVSPLVQAGAGELVRIGSRLGLAPGAWTEPVYTLRDMLGDQMESQVLKPGRELPSAIKASYVAPDRDWQEAELPPLAVPGSPDRPADEGVRELKLRMVTSATQAMRVQKIGAQQAGAQRTLACVAPPDSADVVAGANITAAFPAPFARLNRDYRVRSSHPGLWVADVEGGVALRNPVELVETSEDHFAWDPETDEFDVVGEAFVPPSPSLAAPGALTLESGESVALSGETRIRASFAPVSAADEYELESAVSGEGGGTISIIPADQVDGAGDVYAFLPAVAGVEYDIRVRAAQKVADGDRVSDWTSAAVTALPPDVDLDTPTDGSASPGGAGEIVVSFTAPNSADYEGMEIWGADADDVGTASLLEKVYGSPNAAVELTESGLGSGVTRYYWARSLGPYSTTSAYTPSVSATTT